MYQSYIAGQTTLTLSLDFSILKNNPAQIISDFVASIPDNIMLKNQANIGRNISYHTINNFRASNHDDKMIKLAKTKSGCQR
jgi:hypothetical protein